MHNLSYRPTQISSKRVYMFGAGRSDGAADMKNLLGGKGANLAEMASLGLPVPPGFTITTEVCAAFYANGRALPEGLKAEAEAALAEIAAAVGAKFGDVQSPLLVSVRSGARASMPGMMDTILNLGLNDATVKGLAAKSGNARFAYDSYRRFIQMYADVVLGVDHGVFEDILDNHKNLNGHSLDTDLKADDWQDVIGEYLAAVARETGKPFPQNTSEQLWGAISAVFGSWHNDRAKTYRRLHAIPNSWGTAVNVQAMVFGNLGQSSATGVAFTRNPSTGAREIYGEFLVNAQGEDVVAGIRTPQPLTEAARKQAGETLPSLETLMPQTFAELQQGVRRSGAALPRHAGHRVHHPGRQALDAADSLGQAHHQGCAQDRCRPGGRRSVRRGGSGAARRRGRPRSAPAPHDCPRRGKACDRHGTAGIARGGVG